MKCVLELYGKSYESTEFTERQVTGYIAAACGMTGINIRDLFQSLINFNGLKGKGFRDYPSTESAEIDMVFILAKVFPTLDRDIDSIDTEELILIVTPMLGALNKTPKSLAVVPVEPTAIVPVESAAAVEAIDWEYPPGDTLLLSPQEEEAIDYASQVSLSSPAKIKCWFAWWQSVNEGEEVSTAVAIDVLMEFTEQQFTEDECGRYYALVTAHLEKTAPIAA